MFIQALVVGHASEYNNAFFGDMPVFTVSS